jgi:hypothetical protein
MFICTYVYDDENKDIVLYCVKVNPSIGKQIDMCFQSVCSRFSTFDCLVYWEKLLSNVSHIAGDVKI